MREIKFRAWDKSEKQMIGADAWFFSDEFEPFVDSVKRAQENFEIMQFTGLHDKRGKEIYEGDIVLVRDALGQEAINKIQMSDGCWEIQSNATGRDYLKCHTVNHAVEVIGSIYENPELLQQKGPQNV